METEKINRLEVIGDERLLVKYLKENEYLDLSLQDDGKTLKIFIQERHR